MQRLEVSGAVRPICGSLGVKRLTVLAALLLTIQVFWDVSSCRLVNRDVSENRDVFAFRVTPSYLHKRPHDKGKTFPRHVCRYLTADMV